MTRKLTLQRWWLPLLTCMLFSGSMWAQSYGHLFTEDSGYPKGINTDGYSSTTGWTELLPASITTNQWSPVDTIPFNFEFFGTQVSTFRASGNGLVTFLSNPGTVPPNPASASPDISDANMPDSSIAAYWTDFTGSAPTGTNDRVWTKTHGTAPNRQYWVRWFSYEWGTGGDFFYGSIVFEETTNNIYVVSEYTSSNLDSTVSVVGVKAGTTTASAPSPTYVGSMGFSQADDDYHTFVWLAPGSCLYPSNVSSTTLGTIVGITSTLPAGTAGAEVEYGAPGFTLGSGTSITSATGDFNVTGLSSGTTYEYYIRTDCGTGQFSTWDGPYSFTTGCEITTYPYAESFDSTNVWDVFDLDACFSHASVDAQWEADDNGTTSGSTGPADDVKGGGQYLYLEASDYSQGDSAIFDVACI